MANLKEKITAEIENIDAVLLEIKRVKKRKDKDLVVLVGLASYLQSVYTGIENILKQILTEKNIQIPQTETWHKDLLSLAVEHSFLSPTLTEKLGKYLVFRHFFRHSYGFHIDESKLTPLIENISEIFSEFKKEIKIVLNTKK